MADQCIVCLENLDVQQPIVASHHGIVDDSSPSDSSSSGSTPVVTQTQPITRSKVPATTNLVDDDSKIAEIEVCGHVLHDSCLREWTEKANSCPICRQSFHSVNVYDRVGGTKLSSYAVEDKKQVAEFDAQAWLDENPEEEEPSRPCVICQNPEREELTLLCDGCDAPYHTYCVGLDCVPHGHWLCMECNAQYRAVLQEELEDDEIDIADERSDYLPRTQATMRSARRRARSDQWQGAWGQIASHVFDALDLDLDNHDDDEALQTWRRAQRRREREGQEFERWQQRLNIARRLGAGQTFATNIVRGLSHRQQQQHRPRQEPPPPPRETPEEKQAWGALERAIEVSRTAAAETQNTRKRKSRSATASPREPVPQPERRLKRPRTRRVPQAGEAGPSRQNGESSSAAVPNAGSATNGVVTNGTAPTFLSSLLKEVEAVTPSDDENVRNFFGPFNGTIVDASSPATSPSPSGPSSPRALSTTPPPRNLVDRPGSPLSLSTHIEPIYPPGYARRHRNGSDQSGSDSESTVRPIRRRNDSVHHSHIRHPRPHRPNPIHVGPDAGQTLHSPESSPTRESLSLQAKESISAIIKAALKPHYKSGHITADDYTKINRDLSRRLYKEVPEEALSDETRRQCEKTASMEVAKAISDLKEVKV